LEWEVRDWKASKGRWIGGIEGSFDSQEVTLVLTLFTPLSWLV
jgi:hypothetical protein